MPRAVIGVMGGLALAVGLAAMVVGYRHVPPPPPLPEDPGELEPQVRELVLSASAAVVRGHLEARPWMELALIYEANELYDLARRCYERAVELEPAVPQCWYHLALVRAALDRPEEAIAAMTRAAELAPGYAPAARRIGGWHLDLGRLEEAGRWFEKALAADPGDPGASVGLARVHLLRGDSEGAVRVLEALPEAPDRMAAHVRHLLWRAKQRLGETAGDPPPAPGPAHWRDPWADEVRYFRRAYGARFREAVSLMQRSRYAEAAAILEELRARRPDDAAAAVDLAVCYRSLGRGEEALAVLEAALQTAPDHYALHLNLAALRLEGGDRRRALEHAERAVALNPTLAAAQETHGLVLLAMERPAEALEALERALELDPGRDSSEAGREEARRRCGGVPPPPTGLGGERSRR